ncbi:MAG TPA: SRPBCC family protein [Lapillicoccus sp.]|nr:SRPBCC family protein [Lapillicoccus sp.]
MTTQVTKSVIVNVPVSRAYNQWTQFEDFPQFMGGVQKVTQLGDDRLEWVAQIFGVKRQWEAKILEQQPDQKVAWAATSGATNAGAVSFEDLGGDQCRVTLFLEYEPEGLVEKAGDALNIVERQAESDLEKFKTFIESEGYASGAWRGTVEAEGHVGTPGVEHAAESRGDSGKAGISGKAVATGVGVAAAAAAAAVVGSKSGSDDEDTGGDVEVRTPVVGRTTTSVTESSDVTSPDRFSTTDVGATSAAAGTGAYSGSDTGVGTGAGLGAGLGADLDADRGAGGGVGFSADSGADRGEDMPLLADDDDPGDIRSDETMTGEDGEGRAPQ